MYPAPANDARQALIWIHQNIARYGGDPSSIFVTGHSAGGALAADLGSDRASLTEAGVSASALRAIAPVSGVYDLRLGFVDAYAPTPALKERASPVLHIGDAAPVAVIAFGNGTRVEIEAPMEAGSGQLAQALRARGVAVEIVELLGTHSNSALVGQSCFTASASGRTNDSRRSGRADRLSST